MQLARGDCTGTFLLHLCVAGCAQTQIKVGSGEGEAVSGSRDKTIKLWDLATGKEQATLKGHKDKVYSVAFSPDGKTLASGSQDSLIELWDANTGKELAVATAAMSFQII